MHALRKTLLLCSIVSLTACGDRRQESNLLGNVNEDVIARTIQDKFKIAVPPSTNNEVYGKWHCQIYSTVGTVFQVRQQLNRYQFRQEGHFIKNLSNSAFPIWRRDAKAFYNDSIEDIALPKEPVDPAVTRFGKIYRKSSSAKDYELVIEATTSDAEVARHTLPSISNPSLRVFAYEVCQKS